MDLGVTDFRRNRLPAIRSGVRPASAKLDWGTVIKPEFGLGYQRMTAYEIQQSVARLYFVPELERSSSHTHTRRETKRLSKEEMEAMMHNNACENSTEPTNTNNSAALDSSAYANYDWAAYYNNPAYAEYYKYCQDYYAYYGCYPQYPYSAATTSADSNSTPTAPTVSKSAASTDTSVSNPPPPGVTTTDLASSSGVDPLAALPVPFHPSQPPPGYGYSNAGAANNSGATTGTGRVTGPGRRFTGRRAGPLPTGVIRAQTARPSTRWDDAGPSNVTDTSGAGGGSTVTSQGLTGSSLSSNKVNWMPAQPVTTGVIPASSRSLHQPPAHSVEVYDPPKSVSSSITFNLGQKLPQPAQDYIQRAFSSVSNAQRDEMQTALSEKLRDVIQRGVHTTMNWHIEPLPVLSSVHQPSAPQKRESKFLNGPLQLRSSPAVVSNPRRAGPYNNNNHWCASPTSDSSNQMAAAAKRARTNSPDACATAAGINTQAPNRLKSPSSKQFTSGSSLSFSRPDSVRYHRGYSSRTPAHLGGAYSQQRRTGSPSSTSQASSRSSTTVGGRRRGRHRRSSSVASSSGSRSSSGYRLKRKSTYSTSSRSSRSRSSSPSSHSRASSLLLSRARDSYPKGRARGRGGGNVRGQRGGRGRGQQPQQQQSQRGGRGSKRQQRLARAFQADPTSTHQLQQRAERFRHHLKMEESFGGDSSTTLNYISAAVPMSEEELKIMWENMKIVGTSTQLEKRYLRLTQAPDPSDVRPVEILKQALDRVQQRWRESGQTRDDYQRVNEQFKSIRQDLTVQCIRDAFTMTVYEENVYIALEAGDHEEYNQCQSMMKVLYEQEHVAGRDYCEFLSYRMLYYILMKDTLNINITMCQLTPQDKQHECMSFALSVREACFLNDYQSFFRLYQTAPRHCAYVMNWFKVRMQTAALKTILMAYRPHVSREFVMRELHLPEWQEFHDFFVSVVGAEIMEEENLIDCKKFCAALGAKPA